VFICDLKRVVSSKNTVVEFTQNSSISKRPHHEMLGFPRRSKNCTLP